MGAKTPPRVVVVEDEPFIFRLHKCSATAHVSVIMVTAQAQDEDRERGYALSVHEYVTKPFEPAELVALVREALAGRAR